MKPNPVPGLTIAAPVETQTNNTLDVRTLECVQTALAEDSFDVAATAVAGQIARQLGCEHAILGMLAGSSCRLVAWSGVADLRTDHRLARLVTAAMDEVLDQAASLTVPVGPQDAPRITLMHAELASAGVGESILSVPMVAGERMVGVLTLIRERARPWPRDLLPALESLGALVGPVLELKQRNQDGAMARLRRDVAAWLQRLTGRGHYRTKFVTGLIVLTLLAASLVPVPHHVSAPARLEGLVQRSVTAPIDSFIKEVLARPGDSVQSGQILILLNDQDLRTQQRKLEGELARYRAEHADAFARQDRARMVVAQARVDETGAALELVEDQLARTQISAPFDGLVIAGDLQQQVGAPVKRGDALMTVAPSDGFRIVLQVEDHAIRKIRPGMSGRLTLAAMPFDALDVRIERITPLARFVDGRNVFEVQAQLERGVPGLRPGLEGVTRIQLPSQSLLLQYGGRFVEWSRFQLWKVAG